MNYFLNHEIWLFFTVSLGVLGAWLALCWKADQKGALSLFLALQFSLFQISTSAALLALLGVLSSWHILILNLVLILIVLMPVWRPNWQSTEKRHNDQAAQTADPKLALYIAILVVLLALCASLSILKGVAFHDTSTDGLWIHTPTVLLLEQEGHLAPSNFPFIAAYPKSIHLWYYWIFSFFGDESLIDLGQLPFLLLFGLSTYFICRGLNLKQQQACIAGIACCFAPVIFAQLSTTYVDLAISALIVASVAGLFNMRSKLGHAAMLCSLALLLGAKYSSLVQVTLILSADMLISFRQNSKALALRRTIISVCFVLFFGAYQYFLNFLRYENPLFPYAVDLAVFNFDGPLKFNDIWFAQASVLLSYSEKLWRSWSALGEVGYGYLYGGFGVSWVLFLFALVMAAFEAWRRARRDYLYLTGLALLLFLSTPFNFSARFTIYLLAFGAIACAFLLNLPERRHIHFVILVSLLLCAIFTFHQSLKSFSAQLPLLSASRESTCLFSGFPDGDREIFSWLSKNMQNRSSLTVYPGLKPYAFECLWPSSASSRLNLGDPFAGVPSISGKEYLLVAREKLNTQSLNKLENMYQVVLETADSLLLSSK